MLAGGLSAADAADVTDMVFAAVRRWTVRDVEEVSVEGVEQRFLIAQVFNPPVWNRFAPTDEHEKQLSRSVNGYLDLVFTRAGMRELVDWKTTGSLSAEWRQRCATSWQGPIYCWAAGATRCTFRGIQRDGRCSEVVVNFPTPERGPAEVEAYLTSVLDMRDVLWERERWPQHVPFACRAYGRDCEFIKACPASVFKKLQRRPFSYSGIEDFLLCPDRYRQGRLVTDEDEGTRETRLGSVFHACVASIYSGLWNL